MQAVVVGAYGPPEDYAVGEVPVPLPGPGQIQVRVAAASLNPGDLRVSSGEFDVDLEFPFVPGNDFAGTVTEVGAGVREYRLGEEVFGLAIPRALRSLTGARPSLSTGALAEYVVVEADTALIAHRPAALAPDQAAAVATVGFTALGIMKTAAIQPGETVLLIGGAGGVGTAVLPLLAAAGAHVTATARPEDVALLRGLGAAETVPYGEYPVDVDAIVNLALPAAELSWTPDALRAGGRLVTITFPPPEFDPPIDSRPVLDMEARLATMRDVGAAAVRGDLSALITRRYPLAEADRACVDFVRGHTVGKYVVLV
ncbi:NADP-dependent oxidoreductase [Actinokineospora auranticolor]|uniref:NADPH:quinone reductase-like Zn-dependent oxidoreductase n=1 Tax=Actinokineospora auranticolor TaxID=155976 RepID=A0A2S6GQ63_9PSEU|nr:NADP-dependent oxidoreductase [Actinokineospora auranticolor]PPK67359.1 NADPH:quinone reductase-like Zn-dependent oxidoreductase [Actinokineospora auranticolor]